MTKILAMAMGLISFGALAQPGPSPSGQSPGNLNLGGNIITNGPNPTLSACGTSPSLTSASSNFMGTITVGSGSPQTCTVTFATKFPFATAPKCIPQASVSGMPIQAAVTTRSMAAITIQFSSIMTNGTVDYICTQ